VAERVPAGRAGRLWLSARIAGARRSLELLDRKRQLLRREHERLARHRLETAEEWARSCAAAEEWALRAAVLGGTAALTPTGDETTGRGQVEITWRSTMGVRHPAEAHCILPKLAPTVAAAANAAVAPAAAAHRRALEAAATHAAVECSFAAIDAELSATDQRVRAIEHRRLPALEETLRSLELHLDELEREERVVSRWARERLGRPTEVSGL